MSIKSIHLKGLNGIRAIAALAVVISHINLASTYFGLPETASIDLAGFGVTMFFALSGFLITYLLLLEREKKEIGIKNFYVRRVLRIWPLYFMFLIVAVLISVNFQFAKIPSSILYYIFLAANIPFITGGMIGIVGHYWSIAVEEQFYIFWPWLVKFSKENVLRWLIVFTVAFILLRLAFRFIEYKFNYPIPYLAIHVTLFDCMAIGGIGGVLFFQKSAIFLKLCFLKITQIVAWGIIVLTALNHFHLASVIDQEIFSVVTVIIIINVCANPNTLINLDYKMFDFIGKISYGIYVIHPLVILLFTKIIFLQFLPMPLRYIVIYSSVVLFTILVAYLSYEYFEKAFIKMKEKFSVVKSMGSRI